MIKTKMFTSLNEINPFIEFNKIKREDIINITWKDNEGGYSIYCYVMFYF